MAPPDDENEQKEKGIRVPAWLAKYIFAFAMGPLLLAAGGTWLAARDNASAIANNESRCGETEKRIERRLNNHDIFIAEHTKADRREREDLLNRLGHLREQVTELQTILGMYRNGNHVNGR